MAIEAKRSGATDFNLHDEPDLSESALDGVVGGVAGPTTKAKQKHDDTTLIEISSLLQNSDEIALIQHGHSSPTKSVTGSDKPAAELSQLVHKDAEMLGDLSSKLSPIQMEKLLTQLERSDGQTTLKQIGKDASTILGDGLANGAHLKDETNFANKDYGGKGEHPGGHTTIDVMKSELAYLKTLDGMQKEGDLVGNLGKSASQKVLDTLSGQDKTELLDKEHAKEGLDKQDDLGAAANHIALEQTIETAITLAEHKSGGTQASESGGNGLLKDPSYLEDWNKIKNISDN